MWRNNKKSFIVFLLFSSFDFFLVFGFVSYNHSQFSRRLCCCYWPLSTDFRFLFREPHDAKCVNFLMGSPWSTQLSILKENHGTSMDRIKQDIIEGR